MATQSVTPLQELSRLATVSPLHRQPGSRRRPAASIAAPKIGCEENRVQDRQKLLLEMLPLVKRVALKIRQRLPAHMELDELVAHGVLGLMDAIAKFDARKGATLRSYAQHRIRGSILDGLRVADSASRDLRRKTKRIQNLYYGLALKLGRPVEDEEMAAALGVNLGQWHRTLDQVQSLGFECGARTLSAGPTSKPGGRWFEPAFVADDTSDPFDRCYRREQRELLGRALSRLRERERRVITLYYQQGLTMRQIAGRMKVDASRVSQIHSAAVIRLKAAVDSLLRPRCAQIRQAKDTHSTPASAATGAGEVAT